MTSETPFTADEIAELRKLLEIEKIRKVKLFYSHLMDMRDIDALITICTNDCVCEYGPYGVWRGKQEIYDGWKAVFKDGIPYGGVTRSASAPNCSYFVHWTSLEDQMTWHIDVNTSGDYDV